MFKRQTIFVQFKRHCIRRCILQPDLLDHIFLWIFKGKRHLPPTFFSKALSFFLEKYHFPWRSLSFSKVHIYITFVNVCSIPMWIFYFSFVHCDIFVRCRIMVFYHEEIAARQIACRDPWLVLKGHSQQSQVRYITISFEFFINSTLVCNQLAKQAQIIQFVELALDNLSLYETLLYKYEMHWSLFGVSYLGHGKLVNCNQSLSHIVKDNWIAKFHVLNYTVVNYNFARYNFVTFKFNFILYDGVHLE